jgi:hypothetical protein
MAEQSRESAIVNAVQDERLTSHEARIDRLENAMTTVLENQASMTANLDSLTTLLGGGIDFMKKGFSVVVLVIAAGLGVDATGMI